jgi:hypothetical protein
MKTNNRIENLKVHQRTVKWLQHGIKHSMRMLKFSQVRMKNSKLLDIEYFDYEGTLEAAIQNRTYKQVLKVIANGKDHLDYLTLRLNNVIDPRNNSSGYTEQFKRSIELFVIQSTIETLEFLKR